jgi:hypothetical protein
MDVIAEEPQGKTTMIAKTEAVEMAPAPETEQPKGNKKATAGAHRAHVAPKKGKSGTKASAAKKVLKGAKKAKGEKPAKWARKNSKTAIILDLLKRPGGATATELREATGWQPHSVRGFLSGTINKKMGLAVISSKAESGERSYSIKA